MFICFWLWCGPRLRFSVERLHRSKQGNYNYLKISWVILSWLFPTSITNLMFRFPIMVKMLIVEALLKLNCYLPHLLIISHITSHFWIQNLYLVGPSRPYLYQWPPIFPSFCFLHSDLREERKMGEDMKWKKIKEHNVLTYRSFKIMPQLLNQRNECCRNNPLHKAANLAELLSVFLWRNTRIDGGKQWSWQRAKTKQFWAPSCFIYKTQIWLHFWHGHPSSTPLQRNHRCPTKSLAYIYDNIFPQPWLHIIWACLITASSFLLDGHFSGK